jgi:hypothetical protein
MGVRASKRFRFIGISLIVFTVFCVGRVDRVTAQDRLNVQRVRTSSDTVLAALDWGVKYSRIFRGLIDMINATDGMVYVDEGTCGHSVRACLMLDVTLAGPHRVLRIRVDRRKAQGCALVGVIAHELYHAIEVLRDRGVRSSHEMFSLFDRLGVRSGDRFETTGAVRAGLDVGREACRKPS